MVLLLNAGFVVVCWLFGRNIREGHKEVKVEALRYHEMQFNILCAQLERRKLMQLHNKGLTLPHEVVLRSSGCQAEYWSHSSYSGFVRCITAPDE